jgi:hypothetical protein
LPNDVYYSLFRELPPSYRKCAVNIICIYEPLEKGKKILCELETMTPSLEGDGNRPLLRRQEKEWFANLLQIFEHYNVLDKHKYAKSKRLLIRFNFEGKIHEYLLKEDYQLKWINSNGTFNEELCKMLDGKRIVVPIIIKENIVAYAKIYPEMPGVQLSASLLTKRLSGNYVPQLLCQFIPLQQQDNSYPVLFSQAVLGCTLQEIISKENSLTAIESGLDPYYFTWHILETLLLHPQDDKFDNLIALAFTDINEQLRYRLINIDGDHFYVDPLICRGLFTKEIKVQLKSVALCFKQMKEPLDAKAVAEFKQLNWYKLLNAWLQELEPLSIAIAGDVTTKEAGLFSVEQIKRYFTARPDNSLVLLIFEAGTISELCQRF